MKISVSLIALLAAVTSAQAADATFTATAAAVPHVPVAAFSGVLEIGASGTYTENDSDPFDGSAGGAFISGAISGGTDGFVWGIGGMFEWADFETADEAPTYTGLVGAHLGVGSDRDRFGAFASVGAVPDRSDENHFGYTVGIEGMKSFDGFAVFGQLGWAFIDTDTADDESAGLLGPFGRIGGLASVSDEFALMADLGFGRTEDFTDEDEEGHYFAAGVKAAFQLPADFDAFITAGYEYGYYVDSFNDETGTSHTAKIGLAVPFGGSSTAASALNPLATTAQPYRGSLYGSILDQPS